MTKPVDYDERQHRVYACGRAVPPEVVAVWMAALAARTPRRRPLTVLDLGSGTGRFTPGLADTFGQPAYGVEPSAKMRAVAETDAAHDGVIYLAGSAEQMPLPDDSCDVVLMYLSLHHVRDRAAAAAEIARVLRPGGVVFVRSTFRDRMPDLWWFRYFPRARTIEEQIFPAVDDVLAMFAPYGVSDVTIDEVPQRFAANLREYAARLHLRAISTFEHLDADETAEGFARLDAAVAADDGTQPIEEICDLLAFRLG